MHWGRHREKGEKMHNLTTGALIVIISWIVCAAVDITIIIKTGKFEGAICLSGILTASWGFLKFLKE